MSAITPETTERIKAIEAEVVGLWNSIEDKIDSIHSGANAAVIDAWHVGHRLIEAKRLLGHGNFGLWQEKMRIPQPTAFRYMKLASNYSTLNDLPNNKREAYLAIGLLPDKDVVDHEGDVELKPSTHHLQFVNRWSNWLNQVKIGKIKYDVEATKKDLEPLYIWMKELYAD